MKRICIRFMRLLHVLTVLALLLGLMSPTVTAASSAARSVQQEQPVSGQSALPLSPVAGLDGMQTIARLAEQMAEAHPDDATSPDVTDDPPFLPTPIAAQRVDMAAAATAAQATPAPTPVTSGDEVVIGPQGGAMRSTDGRITIEAPAGAVDRPTRFLYTTDDLEARQRRGFLAPWVIRLTAVDATSGAAITTFAKPLTLRTAFDDKALAERDWRPGRLSFYYYASDIDSWVAMATQTDGHGGLAATTTHFTDFGAGMGPEDKIMPSVQGASVDRWTGAAVFSYPIETPPGRNGLQPSLSLSYSSGNVDDTYNSDQSWHSGYHRQASYVGLGWSLNGLYGVTRDVSGTQEYAADDLYYLNLGASYKLIWSGSAWVTDPDGHVKIEQYGSSSECGVLSLNSTPDCRWKVTTPDGTQHLFGVGTTYAYQDGGMATRYVVSSWAIQTITDTHGNTINYTYSVVDNTEGGLTSHAWIYPQAITYPEASMSAVAFITSTRNDDTSYGAGQYGDWKIDAISVTLAGDQIRTYNLSYGNGVAYRTYGGDFPGRLLLAGLTISDSANSATLPPYQFSYVTCQDLVNFCPGEDSDWKRDYVQVVSNGWGGRVEYDYLSRAQPQYHLDYDSSQGLYNPGIQGTRLRVNKRMWFDGLGGSFQEVFSYGTALAQVGWVDGSSQFHGYEFLGHDWAQVTTYAPNASDQEEKTLAQWYYQWPKPGAYLADPRKGKAYQTATSGLSLATPVTATTELALETSGLVNTIYTRAVTETMGSKSSVITYTVDAYGNVTGEYDQGDTAMSGDETLTARTYTYNSTDWIVNRPRNEAVYTGTIALTAQLASLQRFCYDADTADGCPSAAAPTKGDLVQVRTWITGLITGTPTYAYTRYAYDQWGNQTVITDALGNVSRTSFDGSYHTFPVVITNAVGLTQTQTVDAASGKPTAVYDANGAKTELSYDGFKRLEKVYQPYDTAPSYPTTQYGYSSTPSPFLRNGNMERPGDWALAAGNATVLFQTDMALIGSYSLAITKTDSSDAVVTHASQTTPQAGKSYVVSAKIYRPSTAITATLRVYDGQNTFVVGTTAETGRWELVQGIITTTTALTPTEFTVQVLASGASGGSLRVDDVQASAPYTVRTDKRETSGASGTVYSRSIYNGLGQLAQTQAEFDATYEALQDFTYAASGWTASASVPYTTTLAQANGTPYMVPQTQPTTQYAYDALGRTTVVTNTDGTLVQTAYQDWKTALVDENGHETISEVDGFGRTSAITETTGTYATPSWSPTFYARASYSYDILGNLVQVVNGDATPSANITTTMTYDRAGHKMRMDDPDMGAWRYWYDLAGNLSIQQDARGTLICFFYDGANRLKGKTYPFPGYSCPGSDPGSYDWAYTYDAYDPDNSQWGKGQRTGMSDWSGSTSWRYDQRGRMTREVKAVSGVSGSPFTTQWTYDAMNRVATMTYPDSETVTTGYNAAGFPTSLSGTSTYVGETQYTAWGAVDLRKLGSAGSPTLLTDYVYYGWTTANGRGRLHEIKTGTTGDATALQSLVYQYDAVGNVTQIDDYKAGPPQYHEFAYDALNRLTQAQASNGGSGNYGADAYQYSFSGNLTSRAGQTLSYTDTVHAHAVGAVSNGDWFTYDANGNMTTRDVSSTSFTLTYDEENHLTAVSGGATAAFVYDGDGKRVKATVSAVTTGYVGDWYEVGATTKKYYAIGGQRVAMDDDGTLFFLMGDHLGSTSITADSSGAFVAELRYKAWGESRYTNGTTPSSYRFTGQREESALGLYYYGARWYDPSLGRFAQADTIVPGVGNPQAYNRYAYALNNPVRYVDPSGHFTVDELLAFGVDEATLAFWKRDRAWWRVLMSAVLGDEISWSSGDSATRHYGEFTLMEWPGGPSGMKALGVSSRVSGGVASLQQFYGTTQQQQLTNSDMLPHSGIPAPRSQPVIPRMGPGGNHPAMSAWNPPSSGADPIDDGWAAPTLDGIAATCAFATSVCEAQRLPQGVALGTLCTKGITVYQLGRDVWNVHAEGGAAAWGALLLDAAAQVAHDGWKSVLQGAGIVWDVINAAGRNQR